MIGECIELSSESFWEMPEGLRMSEQRGYLTNKHKVVLFLLSVILVRADKDCDVKEVAFNFLLEIWNIKIYCYCSMSPLSN